MITRFNNVSRPSSFIAWSRLMGSCFISSLSLLAILPVLIGKYCVFSDSLLKFHTTILAATTLIISLIIVEFDEWRKLIKSDWISLSLIPGILELLGKAISVGWLILTNRALFAVNSNIPVTLLFPGLFPMLCFINFLGWTSFPLISFLILPGTFSF